MPYINNSSSVKEFKDELKTEINSVRAKSVITSLVPIELRQYPIAIM